MDGLATNQGQPAPARHSHLFAATEDSRNTIILRVDPSDFISNPTQYLHPFLTNVAWDYRIDPPAQDSRSMESGKDSAFADGAPLCVDVARGLVQ